MSFKSRLATLENLRVIEGQFHDHFIFVNLNLRF
jgi:hypothetical protein